MFCTIFKLCFWFFKSVIDWKLISMFCIWIYINFLHKQIVCWTHYSLNNAQNYLFIQSAWICVGNTYIFNRANLFKYAFILYLMRCLLCQPLGRLQQNTIAFEGQIMLIWTLRFWKCHVTESSALQRHS